jgi:hypothetical protein
MDLKKRENEGKTIAGSLTAESYKNAGICKKLYQPL